MNLVDYYLDWIVKGQSKYYVMVVTWEVLNSAYELWKDLNSVKVESPCFSELGNNFYCFSLGRFFTDLASTNYDFTNLGNYVRSTYEL